MGVDRIHSRRHLLVVEAVCGLQVSSRELAAAKANAEELSKQVLQAKVVLSEFLCKYCGAPLASRSYKSESVSYRGHELDVDHEYIEFACGLSFIDGDKVGECNVQLRSGK